MKVDCLYRFAPFGEIIQSKYDTELGCIDNLDSSLFNVILDPSKWKPNNYIINGCTYPIGLLEQYMIKRQDCYCCIEIDNLGFYAFVEDNVILVLDDWENALVNFVLENKMFTDEYIPIGLRPTMVRQYSYESRLYRLMYNKTRNMVITGEGSFKLNFSLSMCEGIPKNAEGYSLMVNNNYFAVVYVDNKPKFLIEENGYLKFVK